MKLLIATDAWHPQTNGVVRTLTETARCAEQAGHSVETITPQEFRTFPCPTYPEIRLAMRPRRGVTRLIDKFTPDAVHVATEGPIGLATRRYCISNGLPFTTSYHTQFPRYVRLRAPIPESWSYSYLRWFHRRAELMMVPTPAIRGILEDRGFHDVVLWGRGVDTELFRPERRRDLDDAGPILMYMGRIAVEKNLDAFLRLRTAGTKYVVGDGPALQTLQSTYPDAVFTGARFGEDLATLLASADVFVFPSLTDTFGLVMLEAMASGVPVAAYPVSGPVDVVDDGVTGVLHEDLDVAIRGALQLDRGACRAKALDRSWAAATDQFLSHLAVPDSNDAKDMVGAAVQRH